ncbi:MAG: M24 family peptidase [Chloroflexi bacterium]|nr:M24 family peptidase [Chloroflexota bacterium]
MARANLDALVITSSAVGQWFTSFREPHEWHDICQSRSAWYILTHTGDYLYMTPTAGGEHFNTTRRSTWVTNIRSIVERSVSPRHEIWDIHDQVVDVFRAGLTEREFLARLDERFRERFDQPYSYEPAGSWDVRNPRTNDSNFFHSVITDRVFREGDLLSRSNSGVTYRGYRGDVDRVWYIGQPPDIVRHWYRAAWECNRAMAELIRPGTRCSEMWAACDRVEQKYGLPRRRTGRVGHGYRNTLQDRPVVGLSHVLRLRPYCGVRGKQDQHSPRARRRPD